MWFGASIHSGDRKFYVPDDYPLNAAGCGIDDDGKRFIRVKGVRWYTNLDIKQRHEEMIQKYKRGLKEMNIEQKAVTIRELTDGYFNDAEEGVVGYDERLDIRPKYQREFVYKDAQRNEVIRTVMKGLPLNVMYWCVTGDDAYEVLDGQQRTISICEYVDGSFSVDDKYFYNLPTDKQKQILDYLGTMSLPSSTFESGTPNTRNAVKALLFRKVRAES